MSAEAVLLALSSVLRPTTLTAVYAMVSGRERLRLLGAYLVVGLAFSLAVGLVVVGVLHGYTASAGRTFWRAILEVALGAAACGYAVGAVARQRSERAADAPRTAGWLQRRMQGMTPTRAALIGVVTHLPGLVYLAALNAIVGAAASLWGAVAQVVLYNVIWFSVAIAGLLVSVFRPAASKDVIERADAVVRRHGRSIAAVVLGIVGVYLLVKGLVTLLEG